MPEVSEVLQRKVGPLPMWGWAAAAGGLGFVFLAYRKRKGATTGATTPASVGGASYATGPTGQQSANLGGYDNSQYDAQLMGIQSGVANTTQGIASLQSGLSSITSQLAAVAQPASIAAPSVAAQPQAPQAPVSSPAGHSPGSIWSVSDPAWKQGLGEWYLAVPDLYGQTSPGQPGYGTHGAGANEVAAWINQQYPGAHITPQQLAGWNGGQLWYSPGQQLYFGSLALGPGH